MSSPDSSKETESTFWPTAAIDWVELTLKILVIIGSIGAVYQYFDVKQENRVKETMDFFDNFNSGELQEARLSLGVTWEDYHDKIKRLNNANVSNEETKALILERIVLPMVEHNNQQKEIDLLINFFGNLEICVENKICDQHVSEVFFSEYATSFFDLYKPWIKKRREIIPNYACQFEEYATKKDCIIIKSKTQ